MKDTKTIEEKFIEELIRIYGSSNFILVDKDTGDITELPYGSLTKLPSLPKTNKQGRELTQFMKKEKFVKLYKRSIGELDKVLSYRDFNWFIRISEYVGMQDCTLYDDDGKYLNVKRLSQLLDVDYNNFSTAFKGFEKLGLVKRVKVPSQKDVYKKVNAIATNPYLYMNGEYVVEDIRREFIDTKWAKLYSNE